jgi:hypothetical protein
MSQALLVLETGLFWVGLSPIQNTVATMRRFQGYRVYTVRGRVGANTFGRTGCAGANPGKVPGKPATARDRPGPDVGITEEASAEEFETTELAVIEAPGVSV